MKKWRPPKNLVREIRALRGWVPRTFWGCPDPGIAFGIGTRDTPTVGGQQVVDYHYEIKRVWKFPGSTSAPPTHLVLTIDIYYASGDAERAGHAFDVDQWEARKQTVWASPPNRTAYRELARLARTLLSGRDATLADGSCIRSMGAMPAKCLRRSPSAAENLAHRRATGGQA